MLGVPSPVHAHWCTVQARPVKHEVTGQWRSPLLSVLSHYLSLPLQFVVCLPVSPSPPPITRWCPVAASTWHASRLVLQCLMSSGWAARWSWPGRRRCLLAAMSWSSLTSGNLPITPVWLYPPWAWSRPRPRSLSKVRNTLSVGVGVSG